MSYGIEVSARAPSADDPNRREWRRLYPRGGAPYVWNTRAEAEAVFRVCYASPETRVHARIVELPA